MPAPRHETPKNRRHKALKVTSCGNAARGGSGSRVLSLIVPQAGLCSRQHPRASLAQILKRV
jgi:hypothetical protein